MRTEPRYSMSFFRPDHRGVVSIGNAHGKVALYLDEMEALLLADLYGSRDGCYDDLMRAVEAAYPSESVNE